MPVSAGIRPSPALFHATVRSVDLYVPYLAYLALPYCTLPKEGDSAQRSAFAGAAPPLPFGQNKLSLTRLCRYPTRHAIRLWQHSQSLGPAIGKKLDLSCSGPHVANRRSISAQVSCNRNTRVPDGAQKNNNETPTRTDTIGVEPERPKPDSHQETAPLQRRDRPSGLFFCHPFLHSPLPPKPAPNSFAPGIATCSSKAIQQPAGPWEQESSCH